MSLLCKIFPWLCPKKKLPTAPTSLTVTEIKSDSGILQWQPPTSDGGSAISAYVITQPVSTETTGLSYSAKGLQPDTLYSAVVAAKNSVGVGPATVTTFRTALPPPPKLRTGSMGVNPPVATGFGALHRFSWAMVDKRPVNDDPTKFALLLPTLKNIASTERRPSNPPTAQEAKDGVRALLAAYPGKVVGVVVENEIEAAAVEWSGTIADYAAYCAAVKEVCAPAGVKVYGPAALGSYVTAAANNPGSANAAQMRAEIDAIKGIVDGICIHIYQESRQQVIDNVVWVLGYSGLPCVVNEFGTRTPDVVQVQDALSGLKDSGASMVIFYMASNNGPYIDLNGNLTPTGQAVQNWVAGL